MRTPRTKSAAAPHLALIAVQLLFATWPIAGKIALRSISPVALVGFRVAGASLVLLMLARISGSLQMIETPDQPLLIASSFLGLILNQLLSTKGLSLTTAINATPEHHHSCFHLAGRRRAGNGSRYTAPPGRNCDRWLWSVLSDRAGPGAILFRYPHWRFADRVELALLWSIYRGLEESDEAIQRAHGHHLDLCRWLRGYGSRRRY